MQKTGVTTPPSPRPTTQALRHPWLGELAAKDPPPSPLQEATVPTGMQGIPPLPENFAFTVPPEVMRAGAATGGSFSSPGGQRFQEVSGRERVAFLCLLPRLQVYRRSKDCFYSNMFYSKSTTWNCAEHALCKKLNVVGTRTDCISENPLPFPRHVSEKLKFPPASCFLFLFYLLLLAGCCFFCAPNNLPGAAGSIYHDVRVEVRVK